MYCVLVCQRVIIIVCVLFCVVAFCYNYGICLNGFMAAGHKNVVCTALWYGSVLFLLCILCCGMAA